MQTNSTFQHNSNSQNWTYKFPTSAKTKNIWINKDQSSENEKRNCATRTKVRERNEKERTTQRKKMKGSKKKIEGIKGMNLDIGFRVWVRRNYTTLERERWRRVVVQRIKMRGIE